MSFLDYVEEVASRCEVVNLLFEERLFNLVGILHRIAEPLRDAHIPYEVVGGLAVFIHVENVNPTHSILTRDVDILIDRADLNRVIAAAEDQGFRFRHVAGVDMLLYGDKAINAVHLLFSGERVKASQAVPNPPLSPERVKIKGQEVSIIAIGDLVRMKLSANRDKDRVHVRSMDAAGLITPHIESELPEALSTRLEEIRSTE